MEDGKEKKEEPSLAFAYANQLVDQALGMAKKAKVVVDKAIGDFNTTIDKMAEAEVDGFGKAKADCIVCQKSNDLQSLTWGQCGTCHQLDEATKDAMMSMEIPARRALDSEEMVNHPKHYNNHPSEVECIDIAEVMEFNPGNAFKYIYRRGDKGNSEQDLNKAIWYLNREAKRLEWLMYVPHASSISEHQKWKSNALFGLNHHKLAKRITMAERNSDANEIYHMLFARASVQRRIDQMHACVKLVKCLLGEVPSSEENEDE